jgi:hypothetical protein
MKPKITLRKALNDPELLGSSMAGPSWSAWRTLLIAAMGEPLLPEEMETFTRFTGRTTAPTKRVDEFWCCIGRRGGKSRAMATLAVYIAGLCDHPALVRGETGTLLMVAPDLKQSQVLLEYSFGCLEGSPLLRQLIANRKASQIELTNGIVLETRSASFRTIRGTTSIGVLCDEIAFFRSEDSVNPDKAILDAARPSLATTAGPLVCISSPHARKGELWNAYKKNYGADGDASILVVKGTSREFNSELKQEVVDRALERDHSAASAEYLAEFRSDLEALLTVESVGACVDPGIRERAFNRQNSYVAFCDASGGSSDSFTLAISHKEGETSILDLIRETRAPFSPEAVVDEYASIIRSYRCSTVYGDRYSGEFVREQFAKGACSISQASGASRTST